jgi:hypothetical protein
VAERVEIIDGDIREMPSSQPPCDLVVSNLAIHRRKSDERARV